MYDFKPVWDFYGAVARGDIEGVLGALHEDIMWTEARGFPYCSGTWRTPQEVVEKLLVPLAKDWEGFSATPLDHLEQGDRIVVFGLYAGMAKNSRKSMTASFAHVWRVKEGKIVSFDMYADTALVRDALGV